MSKSTTIRFATCAAVAMSLSGCQGIWNTLGFGGPKDEIRRADASQPLFGAEELEQGRLALKADHPARAIQMFRLAAMDEKSAPDAFNGLGVAYAKLGRADLAERYFQMAVSLDSSNPKFAANLDRFYNSRLGTSARALAMREQQAQAVLAKAADAAAEQGLLAPVEQAAVERRGAVTLERAPVRITRTSGNELRIATQQNVNVARGSVPTMAARHSSTVQAEDGASTPTGEKTPSVAKSSRISMVGAANGTQSYPARISLGRPDSQGQTALRSRSYPLRIALTPSQSADE